jgi:hypothetical protein
MEDLVVSSARKEWGRQNKAKRAEFVAQAGSMLKATVTGRYMLYGTSAFGKTSTESLGIINAK